jgi:hypothetical protein
MITPLLSFHHFGLAVKGPEPARRFLTVLGYQIGESIFDPAQNVNLQLVTHADHPAVEIIWPGTSDGPIDRYIQRHTAGIVYHLCYETGDLARSLAMMENQGLNPICISPRTPALLFGGRQVSFYKVLGIGLIEIIG